MREDEPSVTIIEEDVEKAESQAEEREKAQLPLNEETESQK